MVESCMAIVSIFKKTNEECWTHSQQNHYLPKTVKTEKLQKHKKWQVNIKNIKGKIMK